MEIVHIANGDYEQYEELLLQKDAYEKEAFSLQQHYTAVFGDLVIEAFQLKVDCIALKKEIAYYIKAKNRKIKADAKALAKLLKEEMAAYKKRLKELAKERDAARSGRPIGPMEVAKIKKTYRRIAKILHPDLSPLTEEHPELASLFQRVMVAYDCNDLKELENLEELMNVFLKNEGIEECSMVIPNVGERIKELEEEIEKIITTEPYTYKKLFDDPFLAEEEKKKYQQDIEEYVAYKQELTVNRDTLREECT